MKIKGLLGWQALFGITKGDKAMCMELPNGAERILRALNSTGFEAYLVGGCVRDSLLGKAPKDFDICTDALPEQTTDCLTKAGAKLFDTGIKHGTVTAIIDSEPYEVTTYRVDGEYLDSRRPSSVRFTASLREDLARRDFTINALAYHPSGGLTDCYGGREDLEHGIIRCVGDPSARFGEDALRIMRALRFASTYGFAIEEQTAKSIHTQKALLTKIAAERLSAELLRLLCGDSAEAVLKEYIEVIGVFIPELLPMVGFKQHNSHHFLDVWEHTAKSVGACPHDPCVRLAMLLHDMGKPHCFTRDVDGVGHFYGHAKHSTELTAVITRRLKLDNETSRTVKTLVSLHDAELVAGEKAVRRWLNRLGEEQLRRLIAVKTADVLAQSPRYRGTRLAKLSQFEQTLSLVLEEAQCFCLRDLAVNGRDLMAAGVPQGAAIGRCLDRLIGMVIDGELPNDREPLLAALTETDKSKI